MIDLHSHILPGMDDGSKDVSMSLEMLRLLKEQGITAVAATSHYYPDDESIERFLERRSKAFGELRKAVDDGCPGAPDIILGAEVSFYDGIEGLEGADRLCMEGSRLLLLEMPFRKWTDRNIRSAEELGRRSNAQIVLAHVDRYLKYQDSDIWNRIEDAGFLVQVNAEFVKSFTKRIAVISHLKKCEIHFIGSDCHNVTYRRPEIGEAFNLIEKKLGSGFLNEMNKFGSDLLGLDI